MSNQTKNGRIGKIQTRKIKEQNGRAEFMNCPECGTERYGIKGVGLFHSCDHCLLLRKIEKHSKKTKATATPARHSNQ